MRTPTEMIEDYLYGMSFDDYCLLRTRRVFMKMEDDDNPILRDVKEVRGKYREEPTAYVGTFVKLYLQYKNDTNPSNPEKEFVYNPPFKEKQEIKQKAFKKILSYKFKLE